MFCATRAPRYSRGAVYHVDVIVKDVIPIRTCLLGQTPLKKYMMRGEANRRTSKQVRRASRNISLQDATPIYADPFSMRALDASTQWRVALAA